VSIRIGSRIFAPGVFTTLLAIVLVAFLISLGMWQLRRAGEKRALYEAFASGADSTLAIDGATPAVRRYQHIETTGHYDETRQVLIDNMVGTAGAGYFVITPFDLDGGGWLLVNRGWVPLGASRAARPAIDVAGGTRRLRGRADNLPRAGIQMGKRIALAPPYPVVANFPTHGEVAALLGESSWSKAAELVLLDPGEPDGYERNWSAPGFPPMRHIAYAVQWFALAATLVIIYLVTNFKREGASMRDTKASL
jgi:surfeit locus 1 family protein